MLSVNRGDHRTGRSPPDKALPWRDNWTTNPYWCVHSIFVGFSSAFLGDVALAFDSLHESEDICRKLGYKEELAECFASSSVCNDGSSWTELLQNNSSPTWRRVLRLSQGSVDLEAAVRTEGLLARLAFFRGDLAEARKHADLMLELHREMGDQLSSYRASEWDGTCRAAARQF